LDRALAILGLFNQDRPEGTAAEVARRLDLTLPTASRFLRGMEERGLLMLVGDRRYRLGFAAIELGQRALRTLDLRDRLHPTLVGLAQRSGATAVAAALTERRDAARIVDRADSATVVHIALEIGHVWPLHAGAMAKVLLAHHPDRDAMLERPLDAIGPKTVTDRKTLEEQLRRIARRGWATSAEETETGAWGVAVPVLTADGYPMCSIGLIEPLRARSAKEERRLTELAKEAAAHARAALSIGE
jgi:DNA-binding IclR family transcriptional regulator